MGQRILIVDDTATVRAFVSLHLERAGYSPEEAGNGVEALEYVKDSCPAVIIMDVHMPEMDGLDCCRRLKADPKTRAIPVIMATSKELQDDIRACREAGCDDHLTKPIRVSALLAKIRRLVG